MIVREAFGLTVTTNRPVGLAAGKEAELKTIRGEGWKRNLHPWRPRYDANRNLVGWRALFHKEWIDDRWWNGGAHLKTHAKTPFWAAIEEEDGIEHVCVCRGDRIEICRDRLKNGP